MKKTSFLLCIVFVFMSGCYILSSDKTITPEIKMDPSPALVGHDITITISSPVEFIMPFCGGITYVIEKKESEGWEVFDRQIGPCNHMLLPETFPSRTHTVLFTIDEPGVYRFRSSFKFKRDEKFEVLYSHEFSVGKAGAMPL